MQELTCGKKYYYFSVKIFITDFSKPIGTDCKFKIFSLGRMRILFLFFFSFKANLGKDLLIYLYSIHRAICRSSDHSVERPLGTG